MAKAAGALTPQECVVTISRRLDPEPMVCVHVCGFAQSALEVAVSNDIGVRAVLKTNAPDPPDPVPLEASNVMLAPEILVPEAAAPRIVVAVGVPASPAPKIAEVPALGMRELQQQ